MRELTLEFNLNSKSGKFNLEPLEKARRCCSINESKSNFCRWLYKNHKLTVFWKNINQGVICGDEKDFSLFFLKWS